MLLHSRVCAHKRASSQLLVLLCLAQSFVPTLSDTTLIYCITDTFSRSLSYASMQFSDKALRLHTYMCEKNTESSLTVARISLSSSHSCFNRLADILRYLVPSLCSGGPSHPFLASPGAHEIGRAARCVRHMGAYVNSSPPLSKAPAKGRDRGLAQVR